MIEKFGAGSLHFYFALNLLSAFTSVTTAIP